MKDLFLIIYAAFTILSSISCGSGAASKNDKEAVAEPGIEQENPAVATLTPEQIKSIGIQIGKIERKQLTESLKANGILQVPNQNKASINPVYGGVIKSLLVQPGSSVSKGQTIATIENPEFIHTQEEYLSVGSKIIMAEQEYNRQKELNQGNAGALKNLQAAEAELKALKTRIAALRNQIQLMGIVPSSLSNNKLVSVLSIHSPISGVVSAVNVKMGSYADVTTPVAEVVDNSQLHLDLYIYEKDLSKLKNNQIIHFTLTNNPGREYDAEIYSLGSSFEGASKAVTVHAKVRGDKSGLIDGMNITAVISLAETTVPAVPNEAIVTYQGQDYIFMQIGQDSKKHTESGAEDEISFEKIPVARGTTDVGYTEIALLKEIPADARIVVKGAFFVLAKMTNAGEE